MGVAKVIAFTCSALTVILMIGATSTSDWMIVDGWREGLFTQCIGPKGLLPVPFAKSRDTQSDPGCYKGRCRGYLLAVTVLVIIGLKADFFATLFLGIDVCKNTKKYKKLSVIGLIVAGVALLLAVIIYGVYFSKELHEESPLNGLTWDRDRYIPNDNDYDNDGILDDEDSDDDDDGILDDDDDNDGIPDDEEVWDNDFDNDGIPNYKDLDDDGDGLPDDEDPDDDNDGIWDDVDSDDDNDGVPDDEEVWDNDLDNDGIPNDKDLDDDGDGLPDDLDPDDDNDGVLDDIDVDDDYEGDDEGCDEEGCNEEGEEYVEEEESNTKEVPLRVFTYGYGSGAMFFSIVLIFISAGLIIIDRESKQVDDHENKTEEGQEEQSRNA